MKRLGLILLLAVNCQLAIVDTADAQPARRRVTTSNAEAQQRTGAGEQTIDRASLMFPVSDEMPEDVAWQRDVYRQLDLMNEKNAPLYYPVEPVDRQVNLFTYLFRLFLTGRLPVYTYKLDGNESFVAKDRVTDIKGLLDRYYIYYEEQNGRLTVADTDIPSAQVTRYYIKESHYFDQRTGTYRSKVTALCPILLEDNDIMASPKPLFWVKYDDAASYLSRLPVMASNLNNVTSMTADDYFALNLYEGEIYKTANLTGRILANETDTAKLDMERQKVEQELTDFEKGIWHQPAKPAPADSTASPADAPAKVAKQADAANEPAAKTAATRRTTTTASKEKQPKQPKASGSSAPAASARRQRR